MGSFEIVVTRLSEGPHSYSFEGPGSEVGLSDRFPGNVRVSAHLDRRGRQFLLDADVRSTASFSCDRCLKPFEQEIEGAYRTLYVTEPSGEGTDADDEEIRVISADAQALELDDDVRQTLELAVPSKLLCRDDCKGLCPTCGKDLNDGPCGCEQEALDPRWEPLRSLTRTPGKER
jgi:uncharacterized protein